MKTQAFTVCVPTSVAHSQCWSDLATSVRWALTELGCDATVGAVVRPGTRAIHFTPPSYPIEPDAIFYNTEQVGPAGGWQVNRLYRAFRGRIVWDYSPANAQRYPVWGLPQPVVVRPGYCPELEWDARKVEKTHDVVFFGSSNPRREQLLQQVQERGLSLLRPAFGVYGKGRDAVIARARLCLNIHFYESAIFESVRCSYLAMGQLPVISEISAGDDAAAYGMGGAQSAPFEELAGMVHELLIRPDTVAALGQAQYDSVKAINMVDEVGAALEALSR
jgi:hypothetical protein